MSCQRNQHLISLGIAKKNRNYSNCYTTHQTESNECSTPEKSRARSKQGHTKMFAKFNSNGRSKHQPSRLCSDHWKKINIKNAANENWFLGRFFFSRWPIVEWVKWYLFDCDDRLKFKQTQYKTTWDLPPKSMTRGPRTRRRGRQPSRKKIIIPI